ncbi:hypothetical protein M0R19_05240 [Candidatus Pacearchaeota archaeon]|jgi:hypothetical protein|nr:hypothetical protein [Candidatus Pacearchaeota archaeon]
MKITAWASVEVEADDFDKAFEEAKRVCGLNFFTIANPNTERLLVVKAEDVKDITIKEYNGSTADSIYFNNWDKEEY